MIERWLHKIGNTLTHSLREQQDRIEERIDEFRIKLGELATMRENLEHNAIVMSRTLARLEKDLGNLRLAAAEPFIARAKKLEDGVPLADTEFSVFSQMGEDGILQYILSRIELPRKNFIEFGVENYKEANTRLLLVHDGWSGLVMDCVQEYVDEIRGDEVCWRYGLDAVCSFVTKDTINELLRECIPGKEIGLLSIDLDGNDYWIWKAIDVVRPRVVICEYNSVFGAEHPITIPYKEEFDRKKDHYSMLYFGASLPALCRLAEEKGYHFIGSNSAGVNAFFVRKDLSEPFEVLDAASGYVESKICESRGEDGCLTFLSGTDRIRAIQDCEVIHLDHHQRVQIKDLLL